MKPNKIILTISTILILSSNVEANNNAEELFSNKCSVCHSTTRPKDMKSVVAPALMGIMRHLKMKYPNKDKAVLFIKDFVLNPTLEKSICMPQKIKRFGLMPSQKGNITEKELEIVAQWMFDKFSSKNFRGR